MENKNLEDDEDYKEIEVSDVSDVTFIHTEPKPIPLVILDRPTENYVDYAIRNFVLYPGRCSRHVDAIVRKSKRILDYDTLSFGLCSRLFPIRKDYED